MGFSFDSGRRRGGAKGGRNAAFYVAVGLCCAAVFLVAVSALRNTGAGRRSGDAESYIAPLTDGEWPAPADGGAEGTDGTDGAETAEGAAQEASSLPDGVFGLPDDGEPGDAGAMGAPGAMGAVGAGGVAEDLAAELASAPELASAEAADGAADAAGGAVEASIEPVIPIMLNVSYGMPLDGSVLRPFSGTELVFCATMGDWRVHEGVDLSAAAGDEVRAAADGIVIDFVEDMLFGHTAVVSSDDGTMLYYCGLSGTQLVTAGMTVRRGDVIGFVGEVPCESGDGAHLHLAMMRDGGFVDPMQVIG